MPKKIYISKDKWVTKMKPQASLYATNAAKLVFVRATKHKKLRITTMLSVLTNGRKLTTNVILKGKNLLKEKFPTSIIFKYNEKWWMTWLNG